MSSPIRVVLADDEAIVRSGIRLILEAGGHEVVGEAADGDEAVRLARAARPDVTVLDVRMPRVDGLQATRLLAGPDVVDPLAVLIVTTFDLDEVVYQALRAGARGFVLKDAGPRFLNEAVRTAAEGDALISPSVTMRLLEHFAPGAASPDRAAAVEPLTARESEVVAVAARGLTNSEIAARLLVSMSTVKAHLAAAQRKTGARNRTELAVWAWETGLARRC